MWDGEKTDPYRNHRGKDRRQIGDSNRHKEQLGGIAFETGDGWCNTSDDNEWHHEKDDLTGYLLDDKKYLDKHGFCRSCQGGNDQSQNDADNDGYD